MSVQHEHGYIFDHIHLNRVCVILFVKLMLALLYLFDLFTYGLGWGDLPTLAGLAGSIVCELGAAGGAI